jgi:hypothetical protein
VPHAFLGKSPRSMLALLESAPLRPGCLCREQHMCRCSCRRTRVDGRAAAILGVSLPVAGRCSRGRHGRVFDILGPPSRVCRCPALLHLSSRDVGYLAHCWWAPLAWEATSPTMPAGTAPPEPAGLRRRGARGSFICVHLQNPSHPPLHEAAGRVDVVRASLKGCT